MKSEKKRRSRAMFKAGEDQQLRELVGKFGEHSWEEIATQMPNRTTRQCRERWKHYLSGAKLNEPWAAEEDRALFEKVQEWGTKWTRIAAFLGDRTDLEAKSRWMFKVREKKRGRPRSELVEPILQASDHKKEPNPSPTRLFVSDPENDYIPDPSGNFPMFDWEMDLLS
jgi:hypothetical protein